MKKYLWVPVVAFLGFSAAAQSVQSAGKQQASRFQPEPYHPESQALHDTIATLDSIYFNTYNTCNLALMDTLMAEDMEFYHDRGGLMTSKQDFLLSIRKNICDQVTREPAPGSIEVYPIHGFGAIELGYHRFYNHKEKTASPYSKYIIIWRRSNGRWQMTRIISLH